MITLSLFLSCRYVLKTAPASGEITDAVAMPTEAITKAPKSQSPPPETSTLPAPSAEVTAPLIQTLPVRQEEEEPNKIQEQSVRPKTRPAADQQDLVPQTDDERPGTSQQQHPATTHNFVPFSGGGQRLGGAGTSGLKTSSSWTSSVSSSPPKAKKPKPNHEVKVRVRRLVLHVCLLFSCICCPDRRCVFIVSDFNHVTQTHTFSRRLVCFSHTI